MNYIISESRLDNAPAKYISWFPGISEIANS